MRCFVTGGGSGIGRAVALRYAEEGAAVVVAGRRTAVLEDVAGASPRISWVRADVSDAADTAAAVSTAVTRLGGLDVVFHAAGVLRRGEKITDTTDEEWATDVAINLSGTFHVLRAAVPELIRTRGALILVASQLAHVGSPGYATYSATKGAVVSLVRTLAVDLGPLGVRVNALSPGVVDTDMAYVGRDFDAIREQVAASLPLRRVGCPEDMAGPAVFLASRDSTWMTGQSLVVDGGFTAQ